MPKKGQNKQDADTLTDISLLASLPVWKVAKDSEAGSTEILTVLNHLYKNEYKDEYDMVEPVLAETITRLALQSKEPNAE